MPAFKKKALSLYLRNQCQRQFTLHLYGTAERNQYGMPSPQKNRSGLNYVSAAGYEWQDKKVSELKNIFGEARVHENPPSSKGRPGELPLADILPKVESFQFIVEGGYEADTPIFRQATGIDGLKDRYGNEVSIGDTRPDIIQILPSMRAGGGPSTEQRPDPFRLMVLPNGDIEPLAPDDERLRLRVIDIKLTSEPGAYYFAEVVYYSMTLAAWLIANRLDDRFVVVAAPAVWPGHHEASNLAKEFKAWRQQEYEPSGTELFQALEKDIEIAIFDIFAPRLRRLFTEELPDILSRPWNELPWHVDHRCKGCEFLGYPWKGEKESDKNHELRCWPSAELQASLCRVYGLSRGASEQLWRHRITTVNHLAAQRASSNIFDHHQALRTRRTAFPHRAAALSNGGASIVPDSGGDALMPRWPDLHIYIFLDYDLSSAITATMGIRAFWREPLPYGSQLEPRKLRWPKNQDEDEVFIVDKRDILAERREFLSFLKRLAQIIHEVRTQDENDANEGRRGEENSKNIKRSTYQIYLWDESQRKQLARMIGRHLADILANPDLQELAWLFPPPKLLQDAEEATRQSTLTFVKPVVEHTVAIEVPHYYRLLDVAERIRPPDYPFPSIHPFYEEPLSDLIPMERLHEFWNEASNWPQIKENIRRATRAKVYGLGLTVSWLERAIGDRLSRQAAPPIVKDQKPIKDISPVSRLLLGFTRLNAALAGLEKHITRAMPPHEREARLKSARLNRRLEGEEKQAALEQLNESNGINLVDHPKQFVYQMRDGSFDVNLRQGEFLFALAPELVHGFLDMNAAQVAKDTEFKQPWHLRQTVERAQLTVVGVLAIDRVNGLIALHVENAALLKELERQRRFDFSRNVILDPIHRDFLTAKVELTLKGLGNPPSANRIDVGNALQPQTAASQFTNETPASEILWDATRLSQKPAAPEPASVREKLHADLIAEGGSLNESQWRAWQEALTRKLTLLWGPPGTGKSRMLRAIALGAALRAFQEKQPLRMLITANTYNAIDNVLLDLEAGLRRLLGAGAYGLYRIQSKWRDEQPSSWDEQYPTLQNVVLNRAKPADEIKQLREQLDQSSGLVILGCTPEQLHNLAIAGIPNSKLQPWDTIKNWFDMILLDEASQMDVATSTLVFSKRADGGRCVLAGDDLQLPPIHQAEPPEGLEDVVGSVYNFFRHHHGLEPRSLDVNYRSSRTIIEFTKLAGYSDQLHSFSPDMRLDFAEPIGESRPAGWPEALYWTPEWGELLDPEYPAISFVYEDLLSSQVNDFEADCVAALIWLLRGRLRDRLLNERGADGEVRPRSQSLYGAEQFWNRAVGVVTPHRAQMAKVAHRLRQIFPDDPSDAIYNAVDTVERYQGQQRDVIIASFGIGDPDLIQAEDEFLYDLNRFNVLTSRARAKVIVLLTQSLLEHLSNDLRVLDQSRLLKRFVDSYCREARPMKLGHMKDGKAEIKSGVLRRRA